MKRSGRKFMEVVAAVLLCGCAHAVKDATLFTCVYQPEPAASGGKILFNTTVINTGTEPWLKREYEYRVLVFDSNMTQVAETGRAFGMKDVPANTMEVFSNSFMVPGEWQGQYYYRAVMTMGNRAVESDRYSLWVEKVAVKEKAPFVEISGGSFAASFQNSSKYRNLADFNAGFNGVSMNNRYDLSATGRFRDAPGVSGGAELQNILLKYNLPSARLSLGDINPDFSEYTLQYRTSRGGLVEAVLGKAVISLILSNSREKQEVSDVSSGAYSQYMQGAGFKYEFPKGITASLNWLKTYDDRNSVSSSLVTPADNAVTGLKVNSRIKNGDIEVEMARSAHDKDTADTVPAVNDSAVKLKADYRLGETALGFRTSSVSPDFYALGNETLINDRSDCGLFLNPRIEKIAAFSVNTEFARDNLAGLNSVPTTNSSNISVNGYTTMRDMPRISFGLSSQAKKSNEVSGYRNDNNTVSMSAGISRMLSRVSVSLNDKVVRFRDATAKTNGSDTNSLNLSVAAPLKPGMSVSSGLTLSSTEDLTEGIRKNYNTFNAVLNYMMEKVTVTAGFNMNLNGSSDGSFENSLNSAGVDISRGISGMNVTFGLELNRYEDRVAAENSYSDNIAKLGMSYNF